MIRALAIALAIAVSLLLVQTQRLHALRMTAAKQAVELSEARADAQTAARAIEHGLWSAAIAAAVQYEKGKSDAQAAADRVVADLNTGALRLRREWAGCETARLSEGAAALAERGETERRQYESAGRIVRAVDECVAQVATLIADGEAVRALINGNQP